MWVSLSRHWPEYLMEAAELGLFMVAACVFGVLLEHPDSPLREMIDDSLVRRAFMGIAMGVTAVSLIYSPWGKQSGAHFNPSVTLTFFRLGKISGWDAVFYVAAQFAGGIGGVLLSSFVLGMLVAHPSVNFVVTRPGPDGNIPAFVAETIISCVLFLVVLLTSNQPRTARFTGIFAGAMVALYITFEAPISGMSMNPARTLGSALPAGDWTALWVYFTAPPLGMFTAAEVYRRIAGYRMVRCAKLHHENSKRCIFRCGYAEIRGQAT